MALKSGIYKTNACALHKEAARGRCERPPPRGSRAWETLVASGLCPPSLPLALPGKPGGWPALSEGTVTMRAVRFLGRPDYFFKLPCPHYLQEAGGSLHSGKSHNHCGPTFCQFQSVTCNRLPVPEGYPVYSTMEGKQNKISI